MKEVMVAKVDKEDMAILKKLEQERAKIELLTMELRSKQNAFWNSLRPKYNLSSTNSHYIRGNTIYRQEI